MIIKKLTGSGIPLRGDDIDTDQIIPARFLKEITFDNMGHYLFYDSRFHDNGSEKEHVLNAPHFKKGSVLIVNQNFGCGSSREHAPQAIMRYGIKLIIGESFAEIFAGNCKSIGVVTCTAGPDTINQLQHQSETEPSTEFKLDIQQERLTFGNQWVAVTISSAQRQSFLTGTWNIAAVLRENAELVKHTAKQLPYIDGF